jgi:hypothetical protein
MNRLKFISMLFFSIILFFGCQKWKVPEFNGEDWIPQKGTVVQQFWTINSRRVMGIHDLGTPPDSLTKHSEKLLRYIRAVVVSSDEGGNYYKSMVIQDSTGGIELQLDMSGLYNTFPVGQKIVLLCNGLLIGDYNNLPQIGWEYQGNQVGRINSRHISKHVFKDGLPSLSNLPKPITNDNIYFSGQSDINKLVRLERVKFDSKEIGKPFSTEDFVGERVVKVPLANGKEQLVTVRTSNFAKFRNLIIEDKEYSLTGILTIYRNTYQLMIRTKEDIKISNSESLLFDFSSNPVGDGKWSTYSLLGNAKWGFRANSMQHQGNDFHQTEIDDWLVSPAITYADFANGYLHFEHQLPVLNAHYDAYQIYYTTSTSTNFNKEDWKPLVVGEDIKSFPNSFEWSNKYSLSKIGTNAFRIAFRYYAPDKDAATYSWYIRKVEIRNN